MPETHRYSNANVMLFIPSFYGAFAWGTWLLLYSLKLIRLDECNVTALIIYIFVELMFLLALLYSLPHYRKCLEMRELITQSTSLEQKKSRANKPLLLLLHVIGFIGLAKYMVDFSKAMGGLKWFIFALMNEAVAIRAEAEFSSSIGTQISYVGWIAIGLTVHYIASKRISNLWWILVFLQFAGNLIYIDRTRPFTILFTSMIMLLPSARNLNLKKITFWGLGSILSAITVFWLIAEWSNKKFYKNLDESSILPGITQDIYMYGVSGFAYFNYMLESKQIISYSPDRLFYPLNKILFSIGLADKPPSPILEFYNVPFSTNVGTFLEPLYRDGGTLFIIVGTIIYSFGINRLCLYFIKNGTPLAYYAWATLCYTTFICFFVPKVSFLGTWIFVGLGVISLLSGNMHALLLSRTNYVEEHNTCDHNN